ncbi:MAG: hypothetical protein JWM44_4490 [Bacilli bacterium]|nr:hypothetical protein [Bacilli bacterium]
MTIFGTRIKQSRKNLKLTMEELGVRIGVMQLKKVFMIKF